MGIREAGSAEFAAWCAGRRERLTAAYQGFGTAAWVEFQVNTVMRRYEDARERQLFLLTEDDTEHGVEVGAVAVSLSTQRPEAVLDELWVAPDFRRQGYGGAGYQAARRWAAARSMPLTLVTRGADAAQEPMFDVLPVQWQQMIKGTLMAEPAVPAGTSVAPMTAREFEPWVAGQIVDYAGQLAASGAMTLQAAQIRARTQIGQLLPKGVDSPHCTLLSVHAGGAVVANNWLGHRFAPGMSWVNGVDVDEKHRGRGFGRIAMLAGEQATLAAGDSLLGLNVFGHNAVAMRLYDSLGYRTYERGHHDDLADLC